jgi:predicted heme/steroid binding protein
MYAHQPVTFAKNGNAQNKTGGRISVSPHTKKGANQPMPQKNFTLSELGRYNGENGQPAYVAVNGVVYDVTTVFVRGKHFTHLAGQELTGAFLRQHVPSALSGYPVVGMLVT